jgi:The ARF-like 2 binding protein BART
MEKFIMLIEKRKEQIDEGLLDTLLSFNNFLLFKEIMLSHKKTLYGKEGDSMAISGKKYVIHQEEQSDGEEMPDLQPVVIPLTPLITSKKKPT